ncbi:MAG: hypothetical protein LDL41_19450 [Coleofasciculus sp. S288]|nr:hypothetical protein [Coleofasciculus sp. S288]
MKLSLDRQEKKGFFGGAYYETIVKVALTSEEEQVARKQRIMNLSLIGDGDPSSSDTAKLLHLCNRSRLSLTDLIIGITAKADGNQLGLLGWLEDEIRTQCKNIKNNIESDKAFGGGVEEEEI